MKFPQVTCAVVLAGLSAPLFAASEQSVGTLTAASPGTLVERAGKLVPARNGQALFVGDRVITRRSSAKVALQGCTVALKPTSILSVGTAPCAESKSFAGAGQVETAGAALGGGIGSTGLIVAGVAAAVATGVAVGTSNAATQPVSP